MGRASCDAPILHRCCDELTSASREQLNRRRWNAVMCARFSSLTSCKMVRALRWALLFFMWGDFSALGHDDSDSQSRNNAFRHECPPVQKHNSPLIARFRECASQAPSSIYGCRDRPFGARMPRALSSSDRRQKSDVHDGRLRTSNNLLVAAHPVHGCDRDRPSSHV